ncbi:probable RNA-binding protein EIF1AD [Cimex lectularius]|uniref:Probable RNA-binding protein EIF1AD n=1 Tax=Cimex lectularius TaxID=79782 RepID=A0A8I6RIQ6_CIMLE|nr:probable RNA-binding protein EIF1AD [Cimex lectularius]
MSRATKRKHVTKEWLTQEFRLPKDGETIVRHCESRGNNLHCVVDKDGESFLVSMPNKFRRSLWVKRGQFLLIDPIKEGDKVKGEIVTIIDQPFRRFLETNNVWPATFRAEGAVDDTTSEDEDDVEGAVAAPGSPRLYQNTNRRNFHFLNSSSEDSE